MMLSHHYGSSRTGVLALLLLLSLVSFISIQSCWCWQQQSSIRPTRLTTTTHGRPSISHSIAVLHHHQPIRSRTATTMRPRTQMRMMSAAADDNDKHSATTTTTTTTTQQPSNNNAVIIKKALASFALCFLCIFGGNAVVNHPTQQIANAAAIGTDSDNYASETVQSAIRALKQSAGSTQQTYDAYKDIADIIIEGKGVGGAINYRGVELGDRGYVSDEDTTIYNPGLSLLTESEKDQIVKSVIETRKVGLDKKQWNDENQLAYEFLREKLDPYHMQELGGYLKLAPVWIGIVYLAVLAVQQFVRDLFPIAYIVGVVAIFAPALIIVSFGP